jgi:hypothetical protein
MDADGRALGAGALAGLAATGTMSAAMWGAWRLGFLGEAPPHRIADATLGALGQRHKRWTGALRNGLMTAGLCWPFTPSGAGYWHFCAQTARRSPRTE